MSPTPQALIVEDEVALRLIYERLLKAVGFDVTYARDGEMAMDILKAQTPALIFLDMLLPVVGGRIILEYVRGESRFKHTHVVITSSAQEYERLSQMYPSTEFILKPIFPAQITRIGEQVRARIGKLT